MVAEFGKSTIDRLRRFEKDVLELVGDDTEAYQGYMADLDRSKSISGSCTKVKNLLKKRSNEEIAGDIQEVSGENYTVHRGSCTSMSHLADGSVATVVTSPPYFQMRVYENGVPASNQLGQEPTVGEFCENLSHVFDEAYRVLKADGSLFVNITDCVQHGRMLCVPHHFVLAMLKRGWILNDTIVWSKVNPVYQIHKRSVASHEYIYHFVKSVEFFYDRTWIREWNFNPHTLTYGGPSGEVALRSCLQFAEVLTTPVSNNHELRVECEKIGMSLTHSATFPKEIPLVAILSTSRPGDMVVDMFNGTGTSGEVAVATGRKYVGYELSPVYMKFTEVRMETLKKRKPVMVMNAMISSCHFVPDFNADLSFKWAI
jgi:DNA modification methylase